MTAWILSLMVLLQPSAPWRSTYESTATAIESAARAAPLYAGERGVERTIVDLVALTWFESKFDPSAIGDHGRSLGLAQIGISNLGFLHLSRGDLMDPRANLSAALRLMALSHVVCRVRPREERLAHYAAGGRGCREAGLRASVHRTQLADHLLRTYPPFWSEPSATARPRREIPSIASR